MKWKIWVYIFFVKNTGQDTCGGAIFGKQKTRFYFSQIITDMQIFLLFLRTIMRHTCFTVIVFIALATSPIFSPKLEAKETYREPELIRSVTPVYPFGFVKTKVETTVELVIEIDEKGNVSEANVLKAAHASFGNAALEAVRKWKYKPAMRNGKAVRVRRVQPVYFSFDETNSSARTTNLSRNRKSKNSTGVMYPEILSQGMPVYPFNLLADGLNGSATINFVVGEDGSVVTTEIFKQSRSEFGLAAASALLYWKFKPAKKGGLPIPFALQQEFSFNRSYLIPEVRDRARKIKQEKLDFITKPKELDKTPNPTMIESPVFPPELESRGMEGKVKIRFLIDSGGEVQLPRVEEATDPLFGYAAVAAVSKWKFEPPSKNGQPVVTEVVMPMTFKLPSQ